MVHVDYGNPDRPIGKLGYSIASSRTLSRYCRVDGHRIKAEGLEESHGAFTSCMKQVGRLAPKPYRRSFSKIKWDFVGLLWLRIFLHLNVAGDWRDNPEETR
jgi:hypothetical protein